jgi:hypothetical protein
MTRIVLDEHTSAQDVANFAQRHGLAFYDKLEPNDDRPGETIWISQGARDRLHRLDDQFCGLVYLIIKGDREDELRAAAAEELNGLTTETLAVAMHSRNDAALSRSSIAALGVLAPPVCQDDYLGIFRWLLHHKDAAVRDAAVSATGYAGWPQLIPELQKVASDDPKPELRHLAKIAVDAIAGAGHS